MKKTISLTFIFALLLFASEAQNIRHDQLQEPQAETSDSLVFYMHDTQGYWRLGKGILDTSMVRYIEAYATIEQLNDSVVVLRGEIPTLLTELDTVGFRVDYGQLLNVPAFLTSETDPIFNAHLASDITATDTARWGQQPTYLTDLDSTGFTVDTSQVRDLQTFVANNSGSASISGTEGYLPKFGASGLTESGVYEDGSGINVNGKIASASTTGSLVFDGTPTSGVSKIDFNTPSSTTSQIWINPLTPNGTESSLVRFFRDVNTTGTAALEILAADGTSSTQTRLIANGHSYLNAITGNVGIGKTNPSEKLDVNGNIKADTIKTVGIEASGDVVFDLASPEKFQINYNGTTIMESNAGFGSMIYYNAPFIWDGGQGIHPNQVPTIGQMKDSIKAIAPLHNTEGKLIDLFNPADGTQRISVDLSETQYYENTTNLDQFIYMRGSEYCRTPMYTLQAYMQDNLDFSGGGAVTAINAGSLIDVSGSTGNVTVNVDLSEATSDNTFSSTDQLVYLSGTAAKKGTVSGLQTYMQNNLDFGTGGGMVYPSAGIPVSTGSSWGTSITNNSANWNTAYTDRYKWDGGSSGLNATTGRSSLGLGSMATKGFWSGTQAQYNALGSYSSTTIYFIED